MSAPPGSLVTGTVVLKRWRSLAGYNELALKPFTSATLDGLGFAVLSSVTRATETT